MTGNVALLTATLGAGLCVLGGGLGIGRLGAAYMEGAARQPSAAGELRTGLVVAAGFIEGLGVIGLLICMIAVVLK